ncbi:fatty acid desaturase [Pedobacter nutrimenti]|nr:fatty acid desaturase [Pedobacter nutrimenti]
MAYLDRVLDPPVYGWSDSEGMLSKPTSKQLLTEFFKRLNIFRCKKNWLAFFSWSRVILLVPLVFLFFFKFFTIPLLVVFFIYSMIAMGTHGTIWHHRYCTHQAYTFRNKFWRFLTQNLTISMIPEEIYVVSHHVHHAKSDQPGDPYNASGGFLYCFLADVNHQPIAKSLSEEDYNRTVGLMKHTGVNANNYTQYLKWGSVTHPGLALMYCVMNWSFWYVLFFLIGGHALGCTIFASAAFWAVGVRTFNYEGHGKGEDKRRTGIDFNQKDMSINQLWPGFVAGEWHNNHHLYPKSARTGFLPHQIDFAWYYIWVLNKLGLVTSYHDSKKDFHHRYAKPYKRKKQENDEVQEQVAEPAVKLRSADQVML